MLKRQTNATTPVTFAELRSDDVDIGLRDLVAFIRRRLASIILVTGLTLFLGFMYLLFTPPEYSATANLAIDTRKIQIFGEGDVSAEADITNATVETELLILKSTRIAEAVVRELRLTEDPVFMSGRGGLLSKVKGRMFGFITGLFVHDDQPTRLDDPPEQPSPDSTKNGSILRAVSLLKNDVVVKRIGLSYAIDVECTAGDPARAARIANAVVDAYLKDQINRQVGTAARLSEWLRGRLDELRSQGFGSNLAAEEKSAVRGLYDSFLQRYIEAEQQQSLPVTQAQVINPAIPPGSPSSPNTLLILAGCLILGAAFGCGVALVRELLDRRVRTRDQLESTAQVPCLGILPTFRLRRDAVRRFDRRSERPMESPEKTFAAGPQFSVALTAPFSLFAESLRSIRVAADHAEGGPVKILGVVSALPNEGKTTLAGNFARLIANAGSNVLLVDGDLRNPELSERLVPSGRPGLVQMVTDDIPLRDAIWTDQDTPLRFLPAGAEVKLLNSSEILGSSRLKAIMDEIRKDYDFVIVDLPPLLSVVDVRAAAHLFDGFAFIVEWGRTPIDVISEAFRASGSADKIIGAVLNKVDLSQLRRFERGAPVQANNEYLEVSRRFT